MIRNGKDGKTSLLVIDNTDCICWLQWTPPHLGAYLYLMSFFNPAGSSTVAGTSTQATLAAKDLEVSDPPPDSISSLSWSPQADFLAAGSWDNNVRIYEVGASGQTQVHVLG